MFFVFYCSSIQPQTEMSVQSFKWRREEGRKEGISRKYVTLLAMDHP